MTVVDPLGLRLGSALAGRYRLESEIRSGAMGYVYRAFDYRHERSVALKLLPPEFATADVAERFLREIRITARLNHPNILPLLDSGTEGGLCWYAMPFVEGESLKQRLDHLRPLELREALRVAGQVVQAMAYAHDAGVVHRDIKPGNVLLTGAQAMVMDFGLARVLSDAGGARLTRAGAPLGTPAYMSPEQFTGASEVDGRSDLYSLGCMLYEMVTGTPPFTGSVALVLRAHLETAPTPPSKVVQGIPRQVDSVIARLLAKRADERYQRAADAATDLEMLHSVAIIGAAQGESTPAWKRWLGMGRRDP